ncbi:MAG: hypothetical protein IKW59_01665 [Clostridia bacterium]|nr:hypothetical protein [Clostridia bacterium]
MIKPVNKKRNNKILWSVLIVAAIFIVCAAASYLAVVMQTEGEKETPVNSSPVVSAMDFVLDPGISYEHALTEKNLYFYSAENIKIINEKGEIKQDFILPLSQPEVSACGEYALIYDKGARKAFLFRSSKQVKEMELAESIILASVNSTGSSVFVTKGETHQCSVSVLDSKGEEKFRWNSGGLYVLSADISDNGKDIAVSALNTDGGVLTSNIIMFTIDKEQPFANYKYTDEIFAATKFSGNTLYAIGESAAYVYNGYGKVTGTIDYAERELLNYNTDGNTLALVFSGSGLSVGAGDLETYNTKGEKLGLFHSSQEISFLDCIEGRIAVKNGRVVSILNSKCKEEFQISPETDLLNFMFFENEYRAVGISAVGAQLIRVSKN